MEKIKVLLADDDIALGNIVTLALEEEGYEVHYQTSAMGLTAVVKEWQPDIIVLDVALGRSNGLSLAPQLKALAPDIPLLFISSHVEAENVVQALETGAVTYLKKPFEIAELAAYLRRFTSGHRQKGITLGTLQLDPQTRELRRGDVTLHKLSTFEFRLLRLLALHPNQTVTRREIEAELWGNGQASEQSLNNHIARLRRYLAEEPGIEIRTLPKEGYRLQTGG